MDGLYLDPPERALVPCVDEKSQIQAWTALCYRYAGGKSSGIRTIISDMGQGRCKGASERTCRRRSPGRPLVIGCCGVRWTPSSTGLGPSTGVTFALPVMPAIG